MELRRLFLRIMLWSLAFAAGAGVLAVLVGRGWLIARVIWTGVVMSVASGLMVPVSGWVDREKTRPAGLVGMAGVLVEFMLALALIWDAPRLLIGARYEESLIFTLITFALALPIAVAFLRLRSSPRAALAWLPGTLLTITAFGIAMIGAWGQQPRHISSNCWATSAALAATGALAVLCLISLPPGRWRDWRWLGILGSAVACALWIGEIWIGSGSDLGKIAFCLSLSVAAVLAHANLMLLCPLKAGQTWLRTGTVIALALTAAWLDSIVINDEILGGATDSEFLARGAGATGIVAACGTLALLVLARLNRSVDYEDSSELPVAMTVVCPRCRRRQTIPIGAATCAACNLRIHTRIEEPRCPNCDYLLYGLTSDRCPECGEAI